MLIHSSLISTMINISIETARRFILGKQGLWPGRRWRGLRGTEAAMRAMEHLQLDPLQIIARSQDLKLHSRVLNYTPGMWEVPTYKQRKFFDWGGWLAVQPMDELPYWRVIMRREVAMFPQLRKTMREHAAAVDEMRVILRERGTVSNRDFEMHTRTRTQSYRGRKDSAVALYYLWRTGEVMTHHRERFERVYALTENVAPANLIYEAGDAETDRFVLKKLVSFYGLSQLTSIGYALAYAVGTSAIKRMREQLVADGDLIQVQVDGWKGERYALASDAKLLEDLNAGRVPKAWKPLDTTTQEEAVFLAPLDVVSARGRAKQVFNFEYIWEVYKPEHLRRWGYYTLPILWGDQLLARFDSKLDRTTNTFVLNGLWLEDAKLAKNDAFAEALARGMGRFLTFLGADKFDVKAVQQPTLRKRLRVVTPLPPSALAKAAER